MRPVERYRAWALRGPFVLRHDNGSTKVPWPPADVLLAYNPDDTLRARLRLLAGSRAPELAEVTREDDPEVLRLIVADLAEFFGCTRARRLAALLDRYGDAIASDFDALYRLDVLDVFRGSLVPDQAMARVDGLPRHSRLAEALAQDDEMAALSTDDQEETAPEVKFTEWTPEAERLTAAVDMLGAILSAMAGIAGSRMTIPPEPRPVGAHTRLKAKREDADYDDVVADVLEAQARHAAETKTTEEG